MSYQHYSIRNYRPSDFDDFVRLRAESAMLSPTNEEILSPETIRQYLERPNCSPERDLFVAEIAGKIVGYIDVAPELAIRRVVLDCWVTREHRRRGLAARLLEYAIQRGQELGAEVAHVNIHKDNSVARSVLSKLGFECVRRFLELRLDMAEVRWQDIDEAAPICRSLQRGEEDRLTRIQNRSFAGSWGYNPNTLEDVAYWTSLSRFSLDDIILAYDGDKVAGYCATEIIYEGESTIGGEKGRISMLGVDPDYRGRGVGKKVLLAGLAHLKSKGLNVVRLTVDSKNKSARTLYRSVGFKPCDTTLWYEKIVP